MIRQEVPQWPDDAFRNRRLCAAAAAQTVTWQHVANNADDAPGSGTGYLFRSYNQPSINSDGLVVFRARSSSGGQQIDGVYTVDPVGGVISKVLARNDTVPDPNNTLYTGELAAFSGIPFNSPHRCQLVAAGHARPEPARMDLYPRRQRNPGRHLRHLCVRWRPGLDRSQPARCGCGAGSGDTELPVVRRTRCRTGHTLRSIPWISDRCLEATMSPSRATAPIPSTGWERPASTTATSHHLADALHRPGRQFEHADPEPACRRRREVRCHGTAECGCIQHLLHRLGQRGCAHHGRHLPRPSPCKLAPGMLLNAVPLPLTTIVGIGDQVPGQAPGETFTNFGEALSLSNDGNHVAFWASWGTRTVPKILTAQPMDVPRWSPTATSYTRRATPWTCPCIRASSSTTKPPPRSIR